MSFNQPTSGAWLKPAEHEGHLMLVTRVHLIEPRFDQLKGADTDVATLDVVDLDEARPFLRTRVLNGHPGIVNRLRAEYQRGGMVLGRIGRGVSKTPGYRPPWLLTPYVEGTDDVRARAWLETARRGSVAPSLSATAPPPPAGTGARDQAGLSPEARAALAALTDLPQDVKADPGERRP